MKIILPIICSLLLIGCGNSTQTSEPVAEEAKTAEAQNIESPIMAETSIAPSSDTDAVPVSTPLKTETAIPEPAKVPTKDEKQKIEAKKTVAAAEKKAATKPSASPSVTAIDGKALFIEKCASCHGDKGEKAALNKSQIIADFSESQVKEALKGYQSGTYGKEMKGLMQGQVKGFDAAQLDALAKYVGTL